MWAGRSPARRPRSTSDIHYSSRGLRRRRGRRALSGFTRNSRCIISVRPTKVASEIASLSNLIVRLGAGAGRTAAGYLFAKKTPSGVETTSAHAPGLAIVGAAWWGHGSKSAGYPLLTGLSQVQVLPGFRVSSSVGRAPKRRWTSHIRALSRLHRSSALPMPWVESWPVITPPVDAGSNPVGSPGGGPSPRIGKGQPGRNATSMASARLTSTGRGGSKLTGYLSGTANAGFESPPPGSRGRRPTAGLRF